MSPLEEKAASLSREELVALLVSQQDRIEKLQGQVDWFRRELFGAKSERRLGDAVDAQQLHLGEPLSQKAPPAAPLETVRGYARRRGSDLDDEASDESPPRFDPSVPVEEVRLPNPEIEGLSPDRYDIVGEKVTLRLAQKPGAYVVLRFVRPVVKLKESGTFVCSEAPASVLEKSFADVSLLAMILIDKFVFHLPLYRQHQRLLACGIHLDRSTLTQWVHRAVALLEPIYEALWNSVLQSSVVLMDETPIKAGRVKRAGANPGKMKTGFFWPIYGDRHEIVFPFSPSRAHGVVPEFLKSFKGTLLTDGYEAYDRFAAQVAELVHALCWSHLRRYFVDSESVEPELSKTALDMIRELYAHEAAIRDQSLEDEAKLEYRALHCKPVVDGFFNWLGAISEKHLLLPSSPLTKAMSYGLERQTGLRVFLENPRVPIDTNDLEREIRPIAVGRRNWLFSWTEVGAKYVGIVQSLLRTCRLQGVHSYTYLVDVLQRVENHPAREVQLLTPRLWKQNFADKPLRSQIDAGHQ
jgi:transposase